MRESCNGGCFDRRDFLKISGTVAALGGFWTATTALAQNGDETANIPPIDKKKTKIAVLFMLPPMDAVNANRQEVQQYTDKIVEFAKTYNIDLDLRGKIDTETAMGETVAEIQAAPPDTLLVVNWETVFSQRVLDILQQLTPLTMIVCHPAGSVNRQPPKELTTTSGVLYIHSPKNWEAIENAMVAANAKKMAAQSRLLRVNEDKEPTKAIDKNLGIEIVTAPLAEYDALFESIKADDAMIRDAMAFKARATEVIDVEDKYFVEGFRAKKAASEIIKRYGADAITMRCLMLGERRPCIAYSLYNGALIPCACEDDWGAALSLMIGAYLFKRAGFMHNPGLDVERNWYYGTHCTCALELHGPGKGEQPFCVKPFPHHLPKTAALDVQMTPGEKTILMRYMPLRNRIAVYTGTMVNSTEISVGCATRFAMTVDNIDDIRSMDHGPHPIMYCCTATEAKRAKAFAALAQLEFVGNV